MLRIDTLGLEILQLSSKTLHQLAHGCLMQL